MDLQDSHSQHPLVGLEDTYRKVFDQVVDAILIHDRTSRRFLDANASALELYGYTLDELREMTPFDLHPPDEHERVRENLDAANVDDPHIYTHLTRDGRRITVEIRSDAVEFQGQPSWLTIIRDISERQQNEAEITLAHEEAVRASQNKSEYVAALSHELRTPMTGVLGMSSLLLGTALDSEQREYAETIHSASESMLRLLNEILDLRKLEAGKLNVETTSFDPGAIAEDLVRLLRPQATEKGIELRLSLGEALPARLLGDPARLRQILMNLTGNAVKFTDVGHVSVELDATPAGPDRIRLSAAVRDTGIGIDPEALGGIFEPFRQAHADPEQRYGGTGLGLAISQQLAESLGGDLRAESERGRGSTFTLSLELPVAMAEETPAEEPRLAHGRVLLVHADPHRRGVLEQRLRSWGLEPTVAEDGATALELLAEAPVDVALVAYAQVDMDGETLGRAIRQQCDRPPRLILLDPSGGRLDPARLERAGFSAVLPDKVEADALRRELERWLSRGEEALPSALAEPPAQPTPVVEEQPEAPVEATGCPIVLVVEDNLVNQKVVLHMLQKMGCTVDLATQGREALEHLERQSYDLVFMDCQMPEMDGYEATRHIRAMGGERAGIPVIALTANAMDGDRTKCLAAGMDDYMSKPATSTQLRDMLAKWVPRCAACIYEGKACLS